LNKYDIVRKIEEFAPPETQENWDCSGWAVLANQNDEVNRILFALTVTEKVIQQARENNCDMIISHHPLFSVPLEWKDINIYCAHTNLDKAEGGTTDRLIKELGFTKTESYEFVRIVRPDKPITVADLRQKLLKISPRLRYINNYNVEQIKSIGFCAGSGSEFINECDTDAFVTGDLKFHTALDSKQVVFDIGHFESEIFAPQILKDITNVGEKGFIADEKSPFI
jgi:dinuclear metal center YbgI/SA1388 family protein